MNAAVDAVYRSESRRVLATLVRLLGDLDYAEDALHIAFRAALEQWPRDGVPANPYAWLVSTGRFKAIDARRRRARFESLCGREGDVAATDDVTTPKEVADDQLRLIFLCCHPDLSDDARIALTLREVCGLTTEEIARAYLTKTSAVAQRIVRAKNRIRERRIPFELPSARHLPARLDAVLRIIYLVFNEGYAASVGDDVTRSDLTGEAIRLARLTAELIPDSEALGLLALTLLHDSRRDARTTVDGDIITLEDQDRSLWNRAQITEGLGLVGRAMASRRIGPYTVQAAIAAEHAGASQPTHTNWSRIVVLYDLLLTVDRSPVAELNRAVAVAMRDGPAAGIRLVNAILERNDLSTYHLAHATLADLLRRQGSVTESVAAYRRALELARQEPERRYLHRRLSELENR